MAAEGRTGQPNPDRGVPGVPVLDSAGAQSVGSFTMSNGGQALAVVLYSSDQAQEWIRLAHRRGDVTLDGGNWVLGTTTMQDAEWAHARIGGHVSLGE